MRIRGRRGIVGIGRVISMPLQPKKKPTTSTKKYGYDQNYLKQNIVSVGVTFNRRKKDDMMMLDWLNNRDESRVAYIKRLILEDMARFT